MESDEERLWIYGINDTHVEHELSAAFQKTGQFAEDFLQCCRANNIVPHPSLANANDTSIVANGILLDRVNVRILRTLLPTSQSLELVKFTNCRLDPEMLNWLVDALSEERCTIKTLILDWNPLELPLQVPDEREISIEKLEEIEKMRQRSQMERDVQLWCERIFEKSGKRDIHEVVSLILSPIGSAKIEKRRKVTAISSLQDTLSYEQFCFYFGDRIGVPMESDLFQAAFNYFDGPQYGGGEKKFKLELVKTVVDKFVVFNEAEHVDPIGDFYKRILGNAHLENLSLRSNKISRLEMPEIRDGLLKNRFLRQLNLYGNLIGDKAVEHFARCFAENQTLQILGLGCNKITEIGFQALGEYLGAVIVEDRAEADERIARQGGKGASVAGPSVDGAGNERWQRQGPPHLDVVEPTPDGTKFYWFRNRSLLCLNLASNEISDLLTVKNVLAMGPGPHAKVVLKGNPVCDRLKGEEVYKQPEDGALLGWTLEM